MDCNCEKAPEFPTKAFIPGPIEIPINFRAVTIPADQGDDTTNPPLNGAYRNVVLKYAANGHTYIYSSDGIPVMLVGSITFNSLPDRPKYDGQPMTSYTDIPDLTDEVSTLQSEVQALATDFSYKGSVEDYAHLPDDAAVGDVYTTTDTGIIYVWDGNAWVALNDNTGTLILYANSLETGTTRYIYKNADMTGVVSAQEILDANNKRQVVLRMSTAIDPSSYNDAYLQNTYVSTNPYDYQFLFLDNRYYYEYDANALNTTAFEYSRSEIQFKITPVQTTGTSTTDVMSQDATTGLIYPSGYKENKQAICIGIGSVKVPNTSSQPTSIVIGVDTNLTPSASNITQTGGQSSIAIGYAAQATSSRGATQPNQTGGAHIAIGENANNTGSSGGRYRNIAIGNSANAYPTGSIALGSYSNATQTGEMNIGTSLTTDGYNSSNYRLLSGLYDPQTDHDAATKHYVDSTVPTITMTTTDPGEGAPLAAGQFIAVYSAS